MLGPTLTGGRTIPAVYSPVPGEAGIPVDYRERIGGLYLDAAGELSLPVGKSLRAGIFTSLSIVEVDYATVVSGTLPPSKVSDGTISSTGLLLTWSSARSAKMRPVLFGGPAFVWRLGSAWSGYDGTIRPAAMFGAGLRRAPGGFRWRLDLQAQVYPLSLQYGTTIMTNSITAVDVLLLFGIEM
jgi:hypothetical protein